MVAEERLAKILDYLDQHGAARISELAELFGVSEMTIHRDLQKAEGKDLLTKVHGGAVTKRVAETPYRARGVQNQAAKRAVARRALELIRPGMTLFLAPGTTITELARLLPPEGLSVITNSLPIAQELSVSSKHDILLTGGTIRRHAEALVGPTAEAVTGEHFVHLAFMAATGIDLERGLSVYSESEARVLRAVIKASRKTVLLTDASKYDKVMGPIVTPLYALHRVVSEAAMPESYARYFERHDVELDAVAVTAGVAASQGG